MSTNLYYGAEVTPAGDLNIIEPFTSIPEIFTDEDITGEDDEWPSYSP